MIITIDGPAGSGKSTIAKKLAEKLGYEFFDTGAIYRSVTWWVIKKKLDLEDEEVLKNSLKEFHFKIKDGGQKKYFVDDEDITSLIRTPQIDNLVSVVSSKQCVREAILKVQRSYADTNAIFEGRDMGTVVFPFADIKFFLTADTKIRAQRRFSEMQKRREDISYEKVLEKLKKRDRLDTTREKSPLYAAKDAFKINTSKLKIEEVSDKLWNIVIKEMKKKERGIPRFFKMLPLYGTVLFLVFCFFKIFYRLKIYGGKNFKKGPAIIASNHASYYDPCVVAVSSLEEINFLAKPSLFKIPFLGWLIKKLNAHRIAKSEQNVYTIKQVLKLLKEGKKVLLFPEGKRSVSGDISNIMPGIGYLAYMSKSLIIPVFVHGTYNIWRKGKKLPKLFGKVSCVFGTPIDSKNLFFKDKKDFADIVNKDLYERFLLMKKWCEEGFEGDPP